MTKRERIAAARDRLAEAKVKLAAYQKKKAEAAVREKRARDALTRMVKRGGIVLYKPTNTAPPSLTSSGVVGFGVAYGAPDHEKDLLAALLTGGVKMTMPGGGVAVAPSTVIKRTRYPSATNAKAIKRAERAWQRAQERERAAKRALDLEIADAFDAGIAPVPKVFFAKVAEAVATKRAIPHHYGSDTDYEAGRLEASVGYAEQHLNATRRGVECPCDHCRLERQDAERRQAEINRRALLPRQMIGCPTHGRRRMAWERKRTFLDQAEADRLGVGYGWIEAMPVAYCPQGQNANSILPGHELMLITQLKEEQTRAAKAKVKAEKDRAAAAKRGAKLPPPKDGDHVDFTCPGCRADTTGTVYAVGDEADDLVVTCGRCGSELIAAGVARLDYAQKEAA